ncbi:MAG: LEA type 2 family protein [Treponema sp.]|nr:LEA type 2 family protein [Treponema sp.]
MKRIQFYLVFFLFITITSCESLSSVIQEPRLSFKSVEIDRISLTGMDLIANIEIENRNGFSIPLPKIDWELFINDSPFIQGVLHNERSISSRGKDTVSLPLSLTYEGVLNSFASMIGTGEAAYQIALGITFPIPVIEQKIYRLDFSGVIPLPQLPKLNFQAPRVARIDLLGVELAFDINVENPNRFPIPFPVINWDLEVGGVPMLRNRFTGSETIAAEASGAATISMGVAYADIFRAVSSLRNAREAPFRLTLDIASPIPALSSLSNIVTIPGALPILR